MKTAIIGYYVLRKYNNLHLNCTFIVYKRRFCLLLFIYIPQNFHKVHEGCYPRIIDEKMMVQSCRLAKVHTISRKRSQALSPSLGGSAYPAFHM